MVCRVQRNVFEQNFLFVAHFVSGKPLCPALHNFNGKCSHYMLEMAEKCSNYAKNWGLCFSFWIMLCEADYAKNYASILYQCLLYASAQGRHETGGIFFRFFSSLSFDISIKNSVQRWSSDFQGLFRVKIRKMAQGSNDLSTLPLTFYWFDLIWCNYLSRFAEKQWPWYACQATPL